MESSKSKKSSNTKPAKTTTENKKPVSSQEPKVVKAERIKETTANPKSSLGEIFEQRSKIMALQSSEEHEQNRSFIQVDMSELLQSANTITYEVEDSNTPQIMIASSDPKKYMITSPDSPPVQTCQDSTEDKTTTSPNFNYNRSTRRIDKAVKKIHKLNDIAAKFNNPQIIFLDADKNQQNEQEQFVNIQHEQEKLEREQANLISIISAPQKPEITEQDNTKNKLAENNTQASQEPTGKDIEEPTTLDRSINNNNNNNIAEQLVKKHDTKTQDNNNEEDQLVEKTKHNIQKSNTISTTSQEYCTPPLSPVSEISEINSADLEALNETL